MPKRTKRYGGFLIGDRVKTKHDYNIGNGEVVGMRDGYLLVKFIVLGNGIVDFAFMPNQLINLTRIEEERIEEFRLKPFEDLFKFSIKERERMIRNLKERVANLEIDTANILNTDPLPSPYPRDVYTTTKDY